MKEVLNIHEAITRLRSAEQHALIEYDKRIRGDEWSNAEWEIEECFLQLLAIAEALGFLELHRMILSEYSTEKGSKGGFLETVIGPDGEPYSVGLSRIAQFLGAIRQFYAEEELITITKDVLQILRDIHYTITDKALFTTVPKNEKDVHIRIEGILRCVFPDLKHKPTLSKPIKNFEPDTGIPSIRTLIEYKFIANATNVKTVADEVLADTRGYVSKDWSRFIYVIYETNRFRPEKEWLQLLKQSEVPENTTVVVLSGEPAWKSAKKANDVPTGKILKN